MNQTFPAKAFGVALAPACSQLRQAATSSQGLYVIQNRFFLNFKFMGP
jgi:hypothetical protein